MPVPVSNGVSQITQLVKVVGNQTEVSIQSEIDTQAGNGYIVQEIEFTASTTVILFNKNEIIEV